MRNSRNISLNMEEWEAFERKLNTIDRERERRAEAFLHEMDNFVTVKANDDQTEIDLPWLEDDMLLSLLRGTQKQSVQHVITSNSNSERIIARNNCVVNGNASDKYMPVLSEDLLVA